ncbi:MAG: sugar phosphate nucleotidyltransferase [Acidimicrobiales bacterium]|nr:sugar phosphate nucleotidyltransferase [Acidimicrobiales bacterium]
MKAVIMAGGEGTRLRPLTSNVPKPMMPLANRPMMEHILDLLKRHGFDEIVVTVAFMANHIRDWFGDGSEFGVRMVYAVEETPLGTAGSVRNAMDELTEPFLVISGDVLTDIDLTKIVEEHRAKQAMATIGLIRVENPLEFGIVITREDGSVERFLEKPGWGQVFSDTVNSGIFVLEPEIFDYIDADGPVDFSSEVFPALLADGKPLYGAVAEGYWEDVGTLESYVAAHADILDGKVTVDIDGFEQDEGLFVGENVSVHPEAVLSGPAVIGDNCRIEAGAHIGPYSVLGANVRVRSEVDIERSVIAENTYLGEGVNLRGAVIGRSCDLRAGVKVDEGAVIGDECFVGEWATVGADVKVYPFKTIEAGAAVNASIVWETRGARSLFGRGGVSGLANVDITPELVTRLAMAYGSTLKPGDVVITARDSSRSARMLKRAVHAGLNATGVSVQDLEVVPMPVTRFITRRPAIVGAVDLRLDGTDPNRIVIKFMDTDGADLSENGHRKIERLFNREDYRRVFPSEIGDIDYAPRALEHYATAIESTVDLAAVREFGPKVVTDYGLGAVSFIMPNLLAKLGADVLSVNPYASTSGAAAFDRERNAAVVADFVRSSGAGLGVIFSPGGQQLSVVDDSGRLLDHDQLLLALIALRGPALDGAPVALPVSATSRAVELVESQGGSVVLTPASGAAIMAAASDPFVCFAADTDGRFIIPGFMPAFDATATFVTLLEMLVTSGRPLSAVVDDLPAVHMVTRDVITPWEQKGAVMRVLVEQSKNREIDLVDGVRIHHDDSWALVLPDPDDPITRVTAEGPDKMTAERLADEYVRRIEQMVQS